MPLTGQSEYATNVSLFYGTSTINASLLYKKFGDRLSLFGAELRRDDDLDLGVEVAGRPLGVGEALAPQADPEITIHIDSFGKIYLQEDPVDIPALLDRLRKMMAARQKPYVIVKADRTVIVDKVVQVMDVAKAAGAVRLLLATERAF